MWPRLMCLLLLVCILPPLSSAPAAEPAPGAELARRVQLRYQKVLALSARYQRTSRYLATGGKGPRQVHAAGRLLWRRPLSLRMEQDQPRPELVVTTPQGVWWVRPHRRRADLYPLEQFTAGLRSLLDVLGGLARVDESFRLREPTPGERELAGDNLVLVLQPRRRRADLKRLVVWFQPQSLLLTGFRIVNLMGDQTDYRLSDLKVNPDLPPGTFSYQPPKDYRIRDHRLR